MTGKETLLNVLESAESAIYWNSSDKGFIEKVADHLIANDVVPVVRCKDCKHWHEETEWCNKHSHFVIDEEFCYPHENSEWKMFDADYFCKDGERKDNG